jgi:hypothetical protein
MPPQISSNLPLVSKSIYLLTSSIANRPEPNIGISSQLQRSFAAATVAQPFMPTTNINSNLPIDLTAQWNWTDHSVLTVIMACNSTRSTSINSPPPPSLRKASLFSTSISSHKLYWPHYRQGRQGLAPELHQDVEVATHFLALVFRIPCLRLNPQIIYPWLSVLQYFHPLICQHKTTIC